MVLINFGETRFRESTICVQVPHAFHWAIPEIPGLTSGEKLTVGGQRKAAGMNAICYFSQKLTGGAKFHRWLELAVRGASTSIDQSSLPDSDGGIPKVGASYDSRASG
jgi:hypothetical protein